MTNRELAVSLIKDDLEHAVTGNHIEEYESYKEFLEYEYDGYSKNFKDDVYYTLSAYSNNHPELGQFITDDLDIIEEDGTLVSYRKWSKDIRDLFLEQSDESIY